MKEREKERKKERERERDKIKERKREKGVSANLKPTCFNPAALYRVTLKLSKITG